MKNFLKMTLLLSAISMPLAGAAPIKFTLDAKKSSVKWSGTFTHAPVTASVKFKSGQFLVKNALVASGSAVVDMNSLVSDSGMDAQFKGPLFLNVAKYPTSELKLTEFTELKTFAPGGPNARMKGTVTFRGETHPVEGDFTLTQDKNGFHAKGSFPTVYGKMLEGAVTYEIWAKK
jgi:polyisoprenoid-binding protein YceI